MNTARNVDMAHGIEINSDRMTVEIDLKENAVYVVKDGNISVVTSPVSGFGEYKICYKDHKPYDIVKSERTRFQGQGEV